MLDVLGLILGTKKTPGSPSPFQFIPKLISRVKVRALMWRNSSVLHKLVEPCKCPPPSPFVFIPSCILLRRLSTRFWRVSEKLIPFVRSFTDIG